MEIGRGDGGGLCGRRGRETTSVVHSMHLVDVHNIYTDIRWYIHDTYKNSLVGIHCAHRVTVTGVRRVGTEKHVNGGNNIYCI